MLPRRFLKELIQRNLAGKSDIDINTLTKVNDDAKSCVFDLFWVIIEN